MPDNINVFSRELRKTIKKDCPLIEGAYVEFWDDITAGDVKKAQTFKETNDLLLPMEMLLGQIIDWNFADETMTKLPLTIESLDKLPSKILTWLFEAQAAVLQEVETKKKAPQES